MRHACPMCGKSATRAAIEPLHQDDDPHVAVYSHRDGSKACRQLGTLKKITASMRVCGWR